MRYRSVSPVLLCRFAFPVFICALIYLVAAQPAMVFAGPGICGDADNSGRIDVGDAVHLINYIFNAGPMPLDEADGDINGDGRVNMSDAVLLVVYIFSGRADGLDFCTVLVQVTTTGGYSATASPDGEWIAYAHSGIAKVRVDGSDFTQLVNAGTEPDWSSFHNVILFRAGQLKTIDPLTGVVSPVTTLASFDDGATFSPLGGEIAAEASPGLALFSYPAGVRTIVPCITPTGGACQGESPSWSPDGLWLAIEQGLKILKIARDGGTATDVVNNGYDVSYPAWSPDGNWIALSMEGPPDFRSHIWVADSRGSAFGLWAITSGDADDYEPAWSPDSRTIYFHSNRSGQFNIWKVHFTPPAK